MAASDVTRVLDDLVDALEVRVGDARDAGDAGGEGDAIDAVLNGPARTTQVVSLRAAPEVAAFRAALVDGLIRVDTANRLLRLVHELVVRLL